MSIDSKDSLVWLKSMARAQSLPLDSTEVFSSVEEAQTYASTSAVAYAGQTVKALGPNGEYSTYILQPSEGDGYSLEELSAEESSQPTGKANQQIEVVKALPESNQRTGILYIVNSEGYVWSDSSWNRIFHDQTSRINEVDNKITITENKLNSKIESSKSAAITEATTTANTARETRIGEIPAGTTVKAYIDEAFAASQGNETLTELLNKTITNFAFPNDTTEIKDGTFYGCSELALTSLPSGLSTIGEYAFCGCSKLALTSLPENLNDVGKYAFKNCSSLALTSLPTSMYEIHEGTFYGCSSLALTSLPEGVTKIYSYAFNSCSKLALTSLPDGLQSISNNAFSGCTGLKTITFTNDAQTPNITIAANAFNGCTNLTTINVPWAEGAVANAPWGATNATINYNYVAS